MPQRPRAIIGTFKKDGADDAGIIQALTIKAASRSNRRRSAARTPDYRYFQLTDDFSSEIDAAWKNPNMKLQFVPLSIRVLLLAKYRFACMVPPANGLEFGHT